MLEEVLARHPDLRLWLENAGYPFLDETIALMYRHQQVYADLSTIPWIIPREEFYRYLQALMGPRMTLKLWDADPPPPSSLLPVRKGCVRCTLPGG